MNLNLQNPLVFLDLETTGLQVGHDHIVQIGMVKVMPDHTVQTLTLLVRPADEQGHTLPIPTETTAIHGISNDMVRNQPTFRELAPQIDAFLLHADLAGYNSNKFDIPMLVEEFLRIDYPFTLEGRHLIDVQNIFHKMEQRTLKAAYTFYCGKNLDNAHTADADAMATYEVLKAQLDRYQGVTYEDGNGRETTPVVNDVRALAAFSTNPHGADLVGHIGYDAHHREVFNFGKYKGTPLAEVFAKEPSYYDWMMKADFPRSTKAVVHKVYEEVRRQKAENHRRMEQERQEKLELLKQKFNNKEY